MSKSGNLLRHLAIIMDGNGRWAKQRGLPRTEGHRQGADVVRMVCRQARELDIEFLTLFCFSTENWQRPENEVKDLMSLLSFFLKRELDQLHREGVRLRLLGDLSRFSGGLQKALRAAVAKTKNNQGQQLILALSYGGRQELVTAAQTLARAAIADEFDIESMREADLSRALGLPDIPDPDLLLRTSGEQRLSNFMLWQLAYAELAFTPTLWPDFTAEELTQIVADFQGRDRRYGKVAS